MPSAELFSNLDQLERDDEFYIHILGETLAYRVFHVETVKPEETGHLAIAVTAGLLIPAQIKAADSYDKDKKEVSQLI